MKKHLISTHLCTRCGACYAADREDVLEKDRDGYPLVADEDPTAVDHLRRICTGRDWRFRELLGFVHGEDVRYDPTTPDMGVHKSVGIAYSKSEEAVGRGQSGGVMTTLMRAGMELKVFEACLGVRRPHASKGNPFQAEPFVVSGVEDLGRAAGSKYTICPSLELLPELARDGRSFSLSLLPCQTAGFYNLAKYSHQPYLEQCRLVLGPFCGLNMDWQAGRDLARASGLNPSHVYEFKNRGGPFPGATTFRMRDGSIHYLDRTLHRVLYRMYSPHRCLVCTDYGNELADVAVADCWVRQGSQYRYPSGAAWLIARTRRGQEFLDLVLAHDYLHYEPVDPRVPQEHWKEGFVYRKVRAYNRIRQYARAGIPTPDLDVPMPEYDARFRTADRLELLLRSVFRIQCFRLLFLKWWIRSSRPDASRLESAAFQILKQRVFTHVSDVLTLRKVLSGSVLVVSRSARRTFHVLARLAGVLPRKAKRLLATTS